MKPKFIIVRAHPDLALLEPKVNAQVDYSPHGAPFYDSDTREWCQAMTLNVPTPEGETRLREPQKGNRK